MRASVVFLFAFLALVFVVTYAADEKEAGVSLVSMKEDSDDTSVDGARIKRARRPPGRQHRPPGGRPHRPPHGPHRRPGRQPPPPPRRHAGAKTSRRVYRGRHSHVAGCICWYWNSAFYAKWTSYGCKSKGNRGCGAAVYNFQQGRWRWCEVTGDRGGKCKCYDNTSNRRVKCKNRK